MVSELQINIKDISDLVNWLNDDLHLDYIGRWHWGAAAGDTITAIVYDTLTDADMIIFKLKFGL